MKFFLKINLSKENSVSVAKQVLEILDDSNHQYMLCCDDKLGEIVTADRCAVSQTEGISWCDAIITVGGDGTLLNVGKIASDFDKPIFGINTGHLGFLTAIERNELALLKELENCDVFTVKKHHFIQIKINDSDWKYCLNDVVVSKNIYSNTVQLLLHSNGSQIMQFSGDGVIIATSTGSTAYSLSVGGPIVDSDLEAMIISPVAPHSLNRTSMVLGKDKHITISASDRNNYKAYIAFDGADHAEIGSEDEITVRLSDKYVSIYTLGKFGQFEKVDKKLKSR
ncbi:MAG: NAD(+)/NADH kinase [Oscillospiraceae bacterium]|nr:NAD(+)/NADH kinase [Oscillospiraceae bacterium]MBQ6851018.1 NAD(+)/NADH kinase [Oscillospiraceae bacterium]